jgi:uncharacterized RmlC-like cupin family protein
MSTVSVGSAAELPQQAPNPSGLRRLEVLPGERALTQRLGVGIVYTPVGSGSATPHHHGPAETAVYVLDGSVGFHCGGELRESVEAGPGAFVFIAPHAVHQEYNPDAARPSTIVVVRDVRGSSYFPAVAPEAAPPGGTGVSVLADGLGGGASSAQNVRLTERTLAADERITLDPANHETAITVLAGAARVGADDEPGTIGHAGQWFYLGATTPVAVSNSGDQEARLLVVQGPLLSA